VIAVIALIVAVAGGTFAVAAKKGSSQKKVITKISTKVSGKVARRVVRQLAGGLSVRHALSADSAVSAAAANSAGTTANVNGVSIKRFFAQDPGNTPLHPIATAGALTVQAQCDGAGHPELRVSLSETTNVMYLIGDESTVGSTELPAGTTTSITNKPPSGNLGRADFVTYGSHTHYRIEWFVRAVGGLPPLGNGDLCFYSGFIESG
jgi:hypothetical protein